MPPKPEELPTSDDHDIEVDPDALVLDDVEPFADAAPAEVEPGEQVEREELAEVEQHPDVLGG